MDKMINEKNYKEIMVDGTLTIGDNMEVSLENINDITIKAGNSNKITVGNNCEINCGSCNKITVGDSNIITMEENNKLKGCLYNQVKAGKKCKVKLKDGNTIEVGKNSKVKVEVDNEIKAGENCKVTSDHENEIKVKSNSKILAKDYCDITLEGINILLEIKGKFGETTINNIAEDSIIILRDKENKYKVYNTNDLKQNILIEINDDYKLKLSQK
jgi:hypothetical protein